MKNPLLSFLLFLLLVCCLPVPAQSRTPIAAELYGASAAAQRHSVVSTPIEPVRPSKKKQARKTKDYDNKNFWIFFALMSLFFGYAPLSVLMVFLLRSVIVLAGAFKGFLIAGVVLMVLLYGIYLGVLSDENDLPRIYYFLQLVSVMSFGLSVGILFFGLLFNPILANFLLFALFFLLGIALLWLFVDKAKGFDMQAYKSPSSDSSDDDSNSDDNNNNNDNNNNDSPSPKPEKPRK